MTSAPLTSVSKWGSIEEAERARRIRLALWAYAYEFKSESLVSDAKFDEVAKEIDPAILTGHAILDHFFQTVFSPHTGQWVHSHPELGKLAALYDRLLTRSDE